MRGTKEKDNIYILTKEERRARRDLRSEKQRENNVKRAAKMHTARLKIEARWRERLTSI